MGKGNVFFLRDGAFLKTVRSLAPWITRHRVVREVTGEQDPASAGLANDWRDARQMTVGNEGGPPRSRGGRGNRRVSVSVTFYACCVFIVKNSTLPGTQVRTSGRRIRVFLW